MKRINTSEAVVKEFLKNIGWHLYDKSGFRLIWEKINPPIEKDVKRKPSAILFWALGVYIAFYGITAIRYENKIDKIENHANIVIELLGSKNYKNAWAMIPSVQNRIAPYEPDVMDPLSVIYSWDESKDTVYNEVVERLKDVVVAWKSDLDSVNLGRANLEHAGLRNANLENAALSSTNLKKANLINANLENANIWYANLENADLRGANLKNAGLLSANLNNVRLKDANLNNAYIAYANLENANLQSANLENANLTEANLNNAGLYYANLENTSLLYAKLKNANLRFANLKKATLCGTKLKNADLYRANLIGIETSFPYHDKKDKMVDLYYETKETRTAFIKELEKAKDVRGIQLDPEIMDIIKKDFPDLLKRIKEKNRTMIKNKVK